MPTFDQDEPVIHYKEVFKLGLWEYRKRVDLSLDDMADHFGLGERRGRESASKWEQGDAKCSRTRRAAWISWLRGKLGVTWEEVNEVIWPAFVADWGWPLLEEKEWARAVSPAVQIDKAVPLPERSEADKKKSRWSKTWLIFPVLISLFVLGASDNAALDESMMTPSPTPGGIVVHDAFRTKLESLSMNIDLGDPISEESTTPQGAHVQYFEKGAIVFILQPKPKTVIVYDAYQRWKFSVDKLGLPSDEQGMTPDGIGHFQHFEHGSVYWTTEGMWTVYEPIRTTWAALGWEKDPATGWEKGLGYPISDEEAMADGGKVQRFRYGKIRVYADGHVSVTYSRVKE